MPQEGDSLKEENIIRIVPKQRTPKEMEILNLGRVFDAEIRKRLAESKTLPDFILYYFAANIYLKSGAEGSFAWMFDYGTPTQDDLIEFFINDETRKEASRDAKTVGQMVPLFKLLEDKSGFMKMALKRLRDKHGYYTYGVLTEFPKGVPAEGPILGTAPLEQTLANPDIVYFKPTSACVLHACDDLYKIHRQEPFYISYRSREEAIAGLQHNDHGLNEYQLKKTEGEVVKQGAKNYILVGVHCAFNNEPYVVPVSRFKTT